jgi:hypothetical protein
MYLAQDHPSGAPKSRFRSNSSAHNFSVLFGLKLVEGDVIRYNSFFYLVVFTPLYSGMYVVDGSSCVCSPV